MEWRHGDFSDDGSIDVTDLAVLAANWQGSSAWYSGSKGHAVPEPGSLVILAGLSACGLARRRLVRAS